MHSLITCIFTSFVLISLGFRNRFGILTSRNKLYRNMIVNAKSLGSFVECRELAVIYCDTTTIRLFSNSWYEVRTLIPLSPNSLYSNIYIDEIWDRLKRHDPVLKSTGILAIGFKRYGAMQLLMYRKLSEISKDTFILITKNVPYSCILIGFFPQIPADHLLPVSSKLEEFSLSKANNLALYCTPIYDYQRFHISPFMKEYLSRR